MRYLIYFLVWASTTLFLIVLYQLLFSAHMIISTRMETIRTTGPDYQDEDDMRKPFFDRAVQPLINKLTETIAKFTPRGLVEKYESKIILAGMQKKMTPSNLLTIQLIIAFIVGIIIYFGSGLIGQPSLFFALLAALVGWLLPYSHYSGLARKRQEEIQNSFPNFLDLLYVSVEAGLGFDMALKRSAEKMSGALTDEVKVVLDDISKGRNRSEALRSLTKRTGVDDLNTFVTAVIQADQLGSNIANMLRVQSSSARTRRRQRVEQAVAKLPIKMIFPLVFFFIPAIFIVVLGPAVMNAWEALSGIL